VTAAAELAGDAGAERLVLSHLTAAPARDRERTLSEAREVFGGEIVIADEGTRLAL
jgi:ribonuclease BN (tRNA processing enzyme)